MNTNQLATTEDTAVREGSTHFVKPAYDVESSDGNYRVKVFAPGASRESVNVVHERDLLSITARRHKIGESDWKPLMREISDADYRLQLQLNVPIDSEGIEAKLENGVLTVTLPVVEAAKPRVIAID